MPVAVFIVIVGRISGWNSEYSHEQKKDWKLIRYAI